jgi:hypothetical protein
MKVEFKATFEPIPHASLLPEEPVCKIQLIDPKRTIKSRSYDCPRQYQDSFKTLITQRINSGFIRASDSAHCSPSFIVPKADPNALPRWVCDYRQLNDNTVPDNFPIPDIENMLRNAAKGKIWGQIDMTDSFFQTRMHPDHIKLTAVSTPFGSYEWLVMPMGFRNSPSVHQRRVTDALRPLIGSICAVYLDDIVIWSQSIEEHIVNVRHVMQALVDAKLYCNPNKTNLFKYDIKFLGHKVSQSGIEADDKKVDKILDWPAPESVHDVRRFLGLVRYLNAFLPRLALQSQVLNELTLKRYERNFPAWTERYQTAFQAIKDIVVSRECLTVIDHSDTSKRIFVTTDASDTCTGAVLSFGECWKTARPVAFDSMTLKSAELNYPVHEKELLAIMRALRRWKVDLLGSEFLVYTDHRTLLNFNTQKDLSRRQSRWMEELSIYNLKFVYVKGEDNCVADALSRAPLNVRTVDNLEEAERAAAHPYRFSEDDECFIANVNPYDSLLACVGALSDTTFHHKSSDKVSETRLALDSSVIDELKEAYKQDPWCQHLLVAARGMSNLIIRNGLWFVGERLIIPNCSIREMIFHMAHDSLGHFGFAKTYEAIRNSYFWPNMRKDLEEFYIPGCVDCQRNKNSTTKPAGPLHPLPVPDKRFDSIAMDFVGPLPLDDGFDMILSITDRLGADIRLIPVRQDITAEQLALVFFDEWYCENGLPSNIVSDRDKLFVSKFWQQLCKLSGIKLKMSSSFHPQTDGASERTNKTLNQELRFHVERNQHGWKRALKRIRFHMMSTVNASTGFSGFQLRFGQQPKMIPALSVLAELGPAQDTTANEVIEKVALDVAAAKDNLILAKISQSYHANSARSDAPNYKVGDLVMLSTLNRRREYLANTEKRVAKFMPRFDGPYEVINSNVAASTVTLAMPSARNVFPTFHTSLIKIFVQNDNVKFPTRSLDAPGPVSVDGHDEYFVDKFVDHRVVNGKTYYLVRWVNEGPSQDRWIVGEDLEENEALDVYWDSLGRSVPR